MIETLLMNYLEDCLQVDVYFEIPKGKIEKYIVIEKTGGSETDHVCDSTFAIQSYEDSLAEAAKLNQKVIEAMRDFETLDEICECTLNSNYNYTDVEIKKYRYQAVFDITHYQ